MIMRLHLGGDRIRFLELYDPRVVAKGGNYPVGGEFICRTFDVRPKESVDCLFSVFYFGFEYLVKTVFRPCLSDCLKLDFCWLATEFFEICPNRGYFILTKSGLEPSAKLKRLF